MICPMKQAVQRRLFERHVDEYVATSRKSGHLVAHASSLRTLYAQLKRKKTDLSKTFVEKLPPKDVAVVYSVPLHFIRQNSASVGSRRVLRPVRHHL